MDMKNNDCKALDKFYTNSDIADKLIDKACDVLGVNFAWQNGTGLSNPTMRVFLR